MSNKERSHKSRVGLVILLICIIAAIVVVIINPFEQLAQLLPSETAETDTVETILSVRVTPAQKVNLRAYIKTNGNVVDPKTMDVYTDVTGKLTRLDVQVGDRLAVDQVVATIDPSRPGMTFRETVVESPAEGTVLAINYAVGATVSPQLALMRLGMLDRLEVEVPIAERYIGQIGIGSESIATFTAYPGKIFTGTIVRMSPKLDPATRTLLVGIAIDDPEMLIKAGMFPSVVIYTEEADDVLVVNRSSILYDGNQAYVYVVDSSNIARKRDITLGLVVDEQAEVVDGLIAGDAVVVQGQTLVTDGAVVRVVD